MKYAKSMPKAGITGRQDEPHSPVPSGSGMVKKSLGDETALNGQLPPGQYIQDQMGNDSLAKTASMKTNYASDLLKSGTSYLN